MVEMLAILSSISVDTKSTVTIKHKKEKKTQRDQILFVLGQSIHLKRILLMNETVIFHIVHASTKKKNY